jgi:uncharacterized cupredoxin-like copper-binding protein
MPNRLRAARLAAVLVLFAIARGDLSSQTTPARSYTLEATMLGFRGVGGDIDGIRNPTLTALTGETVRITIVNGEVMVHDIAVEKLNVKSPQILDRGVSTSITFVAKASDIYYCTVPGHRAAGMEGRIDVTRGRAADGQWSGARSWLRERHARPLDRHRRRLHRRRSAGLVLGDQPRRRQRPQGYVDVSAVSRDASICQLFCFGRRVREHTRRNRIGGKKR